MRFTVVYRLVDSQVIKRVTISVNDSSKISVILAGYIGVNMNKLIITNVYELIDHRDVKVGDRVLVGADRLAYGASMNSPSEVDSILKLFNNHRASYRYNFTDGTFYICGGDENVLVRRDLDTGMFGKVKPLNLEEIKEKWLRTCGPCDAMVPGDCICPAGDYRNVLSALVSELENERALRKDAEGRR